MMFGLGTSYAEPSTELVLVGTHLPKNAVLAEDSLRKAIRKVDGFTIVGPEEVRTRLGGRGPRLVDEALQARGRAMLSEGKVLYEHADLEAAEERIATAIDMLEDAMAGSSDARHLIDALLVQGNIRLAMGNVDSTKMAYRRVVQLDPDRVLDPVHHPPKVVDLFATVRDSVRAEPRGTLDIRSSDPEASVVVNGRVRGKGSVLLRDLLPGDHHVLVSSPNGHRDYQKVTVVSKERSEMVASLEGYFIGQTPQADADKAEQVALIYRAIADQVTEGWVLMGGALGIEEVGIQLYEPRTGNFSKVLTREVGADAGQSMALLAGQIGTLRSPQGMLATDAVSTDLLPIDIGTNPTLARVLFDAGGGQRSSIATPNAIGGPIPWPVWAGVGTLVVGGVVAALLIRPAKEAPKTKEVANETGTVVVRF